MRVFKNQDTLQLSQDDEYTSADTLKTLQWYTLVFNVKRFIFVYHSLGLWDASFSYSM